MIFAFRIGAKAGEGVMVTGRMLGKCFTRGGYNVLGYPEYPSIVRGGHNVYQIIVSDNNAYSPSYSCNVLLALNKDALFYHKEAIVSGGIIIYDKEIDITNINLKENVQLVALPIKELLEKVGATPLMANALEIGAALATIDYPIEILESVIRDEFSRKGEEVVLKNIAAAREGYNYVKVNIKPVFSLKPISQNKKIFATGNEFLALGALKGGLKFYSAYPMTPSSSILHYLCEVEREVGIVVKQVEDEITAINEAIGAAYAGVRAATGTSGGGFALKTEAVALAALSETPIVIYLASRPGPSTCMPTWTEQGDLRQALHAGQGEFLRVLLAPGDAKEAFELSAQAFNYAEKYQVPVIVLSDKFLSESVFSLDSLPEVKIERGKIVDSPKKIDGRFKRYELTKDGISPRVFPGTPNGIHVASSYEHDETGFSTELFSMRKAQVDKRAAKIKKMLKDLPLPSVYGDENAEITFVTWGSMKIPGIKAIEMLKKDGIKANMVHFSVVYPLDGKKIKKMLKNAKYTVLFENNSTSLFGGLLRECCGWKPTITILKYTGRPIYAEELYREVKKFINAGYKGDKEIRLLDVEDLEYYNPKKYSL
ncbi:MAG: 2-oxoacid:acceptor oxidoreductase subunit alpha [Candidatus Bilamarchaeaceae archaeon]